MRVQCSSEERVDKHVKRETLGGSTTSATCAYNTHNTHLTQIDILSAADNMKST